MRRRWPEPPLALLTPTELPAVDGYMEETGTSGFMLMERAGTAIAKAANFVTPAARRIAVVAGSANNGGDTMCAARILRDAGREVHLLLHADGGGLRGDPARAAEAWRGPWAPSAPSALGGADLLIDGLYGGGLKHVVEGDAAKTVAAINNCGMPVLAVDFPTGVSGATGEILGSAVRANFTISFFCLKPGHLLMPGRAQCGTVLIDSIGIPAHVMEKATPSTFHNVPALWAPQLARLKTGDTRNPYLSAIDGIACSMDNIKALLGAISEGPNDRILIVDEKALGRLSPTSLGSDLERVRAVASSFGVTVALLGPNAIISDRGGRAAIGSKGAGLISGELGEITAEALDEFLQLGAAPFDAAAAVVWAIGEASSRVASPADIRAKVGTQLS